MGIKDRINTAKFLIVNGHLNDALILILVAVAASSRKKFSRTDITTDGEAFKTFLKAGIKNILYPGKDGDVNYRDGIKLTFSPENKKNWRTEHSIEDIIYEQYRCTFMHEGELPPEVMFTGDNMPVREYIEVTLYDESTATLAVTHDEVLVMSHNWLEVLIKVVEQAEINRDLFGPMPSHTITPNNGEPKIIILGMKAG